MNFSQQFIIGMLISLIVSTFIDVLLEIGFISLFIFILGIMYYKKNQFQDKLFILIGWWSMNFILLINEYILSIEEIWYLIY